MYEERKRRKRFTKSSSVCYVGKMKENKSWEDCIVAIFLLT